MLSEEAIEQRFSKLARQWKDETAHLSSMTKIVDHPAYRSIIEMGEDVLPVLFKELERNPDHWFSALSAITGATPTRQKDAGNLKKLRESWLKWGEENWYL